MGLTSDRYSQLVFLGCIVCRLEHGVYSPPEVHHLREGKGMGQRAVDEETIPLCPIHHRLGNYGIAFHAGKKTFEANHGTECFLLEQTNQLLEEYYDTEG